jgi:hypothetical protein
LPMPPNCGSLALSSDIREDSFSGLRPCAHQLDHLLAKPNRIWWM